MFFKHRTYGRIHLEHAELYSCVNPCQHQEVRTPLEMSHHFLHLRGLSERGSLAHFGWQSKQRRRISLHCNSLMADGKLLHWGLLTLLLPLQQHPQVCTSLHMRCQDAWPDIQRQMGTKTGIRFQTSM